MSRKNKYTQLRTGGGYGIGNQKNTPAIGQTPQVNPFFLPKNVGLDIISKLYPSNYYVEWTLQTWREACNQATRMGFPISYATLTNWAYQCSPFIQYLMAEYNSDVDATTIYLEDDIGNQLDEWNNEICRKVWFKQLCKEILLSKFWGFVGLNFSPIDNEAIDLKSGVYKYPMQNIDPINRFLRNNTYGFNEGVYFSDSPNLLFVQPSTSEESFLGFMQPITRSFIQMNLNSNNWISAGRNVAFPLFRIGYPQNSLSIDDNGNDLSSKRIEAEAIAKNIDPTQAIVYPYTRSANGEIQRELEIDLVGGAAGSVGAHRIYSDFNAIQKEEMLQLVCLGTLTSSVGSSGSRSLGEIHMQKREQVKKSNIEFIESVLNDEFLFKISTFYKNFPKNVRFVANKAKQWRLEEIKEYSTILMQNGKRFTSQFFYNLGLSEDLIEDAPVPTTIPKQQPTQPETELKKKLIIAK